MNTKPTDQEMLELLAAVSTMTERRRRALFRIAASFVDAKAKSKELPALKQRGHLRLVVDNDHAAA